MDVVFAYADHIIVLARGVLIASGDAAAIRDNPQVQEVYLGTGKTTPRRRRHAMSEPMLEVTRPQGLVRRRADPVRSDVPRRTRRGGRADGPQRRRQVDHDQDADGDDRAPRRHRALPRRRHFAAEGVRDRTPRAGLRTGGPAHLLRSDGDGESRHRPPAGAAVSRRPPRAVVDAREAVRAVSQSRPHARPAGRAHERRRAADADGGAHPDGQPAAGAARRAVRRRRAGDRRARWPRPSST